MDKEKSMKLIRALELEKTNLAEMGVDTTEHDIAIEFLLLGQTKYNPDQWQLPDAVMNDFDTVCTDYGV